MKKIIIGLLSKGYTTSKKPLKELTKAFYPLKHLITNKNGLTMCNGFYIININFNGFNRGFNGFYSLAWVFYQVRQLNGFKAWFKALTV